MVSIKQNKLYPMLRERILEMVSILLNGQYSSKHGFVQSFPYRREISAIRLMKVGNGIIAWVLAEHHETEKYI